MLRTKGHTNCTLIIHYLHTETRLEHLLLYFLGYTVHVHKNYVVITMIYMKYMYSQTKVQTSTLFCIALPRMTLCNKTTASSTSSDPGSGTETVGVGGRGMDFSTRSRNRRGLGDSLPVRSGKVEVKISIHFMYTLCKY